MGRQVRRTDRDGPSGQGVKKSQKLGVKKGGRFGNWAWGGGFLAPPIQDKDERLRRHHHISERPGEKEVIEEGWKRDCGSTGPQIPPSQRDSLL